MRSLLSLCLWLLCVALCRADMVPGSWRVRPVWSGAPQSVVETPEKVYFMIGGSLFERDKESEELRPYTVAEGCGAYGAVRMAYSTSAKMLAVAYESGHVDLIDREGTIVPMPEIRDAEDVDDRTINDMTVDGDDCYLATAFGVVKINLRTRRVTDSGRYGRDVELVTVMGDWLVVKSGDDVMAAPKDGPLRRFGVYRPVTQRGGAVGLTGLGASRLLIVMDRIAALAEVDPESGLYKERAWVDVAGGVIATDGSGTAWLPGADGRICSVSADGHTARVAEMPADALGRTTVVSSTDPASRLWVLSAEGISQLTAAEGGWRTTVERFIPQGCVFTRDVSMIIPDASGQRVYVSNQGASNYRMYPADREGEPQTTTLMEDGDAVNISAVDVMAVNAVAARYQKSAGHVALSPERIAQDPDDPSTYYLATANDGVYRITDRRLTGRYDGSNAPLEDHYGWRVYDLSFDRNGNLWMGSTSEGGDAGVAVLPAAKRRGPSESVGRSDWVTFDLQGAVLHKDVRVFHCRKSNVTFVFDSHGPSGLMAVNRGATDSDLTDDRLVRLTELVDQDGVVFTTDYFTSIAEDRNGSVWIGAEGGVIVIDNPSGVFDPGMRVRRLKVSHDDGTGLADYFLESDMVTDISVDGGNRKWVATGSSGLYLLSADGSEAVEHITADRCPLLDDNEVKVVYASAVDNTVLIGTRNGLLEYGGTASAPVDSYSAVKVYPNPVTPETSGDVTVSGLTEGSLVKISDASGRVVWQGRAEGGMLRWPVENSAGRRVASGVYYVLASSGRDVTPARGAVARILVVN